MIPDINLLPKIERKKTNSLLFWLFVAVICLLFIAIGVKYFSLKSEVESLSSEQQGLSTEIDRYKDQIANIQKQSQGTLAQSVQFVESVSYPVTPIIDSLEGHLESYEKLTDIKYGAEGIAVTIDFETLNDVSLYVQKLLMDHLYTDVQIEKVTSFKPEKNEYNDADSDEDLVPRYTAEFKLAISNSDLLAEVERP
ncbi:PilN domain-containing protein [Viridibacillus sp. FSL R5-0888]|uniref:PilN domain-containing protein n=1 Tax=Viridibacillus sp. FSL R5-0888 TaxID=2921663 RepID=UPI0030FADC97